MTRPLTGQELAAAVDRIRSSPRVAPLELHTDDCPWITTSGRRACRCGCAPIQALIEDYLRREPPAPIDLGPVYCEWGNL